MPILTSPKISVIIPAYNEEKYIERTLESIKKQNFSEYEVIVVANGCTDKTEEKVKKYQNNQNKNLRLLSLPKANVSVARNAGALNAQGALLVFLDADTSLTADALQMISEGFTEKHAVATTLALPQEKKIKYQLTQWFKNINHYSKIYKGCSGVLICRKKEFHAVGGYNPQLSVKEHRKLTLKLLEVGKYCCIPTYATTSMRRFEQWGVLKVSKFWITQWAKDTFNENKKPRGFLMFVGKFIFPLQGEGIQTRQTIESTVYDKVR